MVRYDIIAGLKNAIERGSSLENAKSILINSGYSPAEVNEASSYLTSGTNITPQHPEQLNNKNNLGYKKLPQMQMTNKKSNKWLIILLIILGIILIGSVIFLVFSSSILDFFSKLFNP